MKRILIETGHPAQVHQFRHLAAVLASKGHEVLFVTREKEHCTRLLDHFGLPYRTLGKVKKGLLQKALQIPAAYVRLFRIMRKFKPDMLLSRFTPEGSHLAWLLGIPHIGFTDTEHVKWMDRVTMPFVNIRITAHSYKQDLGRNHFRFKGNIELFYLHPERFTPDPGILEKLHIREGEAYAILRFISWDAYHDVRQKGLSFQEKQRLVKLLTDNNIRVFISSESGLPAELAPFAYDLPPETMHDALAFAAIYIGEGASMATEAAMLGTPSVYINTLTAGSLEDAEKAGLLYAFRNSEGVLEKVRELIHDRGVQQRHRMLRNDYLRDIPDITGMIAGFVEGYPESYHHLMRENITNLTGEIRLNP